MHRATLAFTSSFCPSFLPRALPQTHCPRSPLTSACLPPTTPETSTPTPSTPPPSQYRLAPGEIAVRFTNTPSGKDVVAAANIGDPLLRVGDSVGVVIPRACQSGLCASCTCDIVDLGNKRVETVRACQTGVYAEDGMEMVIDVARMKEVRGKKTSDPMARFDNMDTGYVAGAPPRKRGFTREVVCTECKGTGDIECLACDGKGSEQGYVCALCAGTGMVRCGDCQGKGNRMINR